MDTTLQGTHKLTEQSRMPLGCPDPQSLNGHTQELCRKNVIATIRIVVKTQLISMLELKDLRDWQI